MAPAYSKVLWLVVLYSWLFLFATVISEKKAELWQRDSPDWIPTVNMCSTAREKVNLKSPVINARYKRKVDRNVKVDAARTLIDNANSFEFPESKN